MERDKIIAVVLVVGLVFLFVALFGVIAVTGFVLFFVANPGDSVDSTPIIETVGSGSTQGSVSTPPASTNTQTGTGTQGGGSNTTETGGSAPEPEEEPEPEPEPEPESTAQLLEGITIETLYFWCPANFAGEDGLALHRLTIKNSSGSDFSYASNLTIEVEQENGTKDSAVTKNSFKFSVDDGKTEDIYRTYFRDGAPALVLGTSPGSTATVTVKFGDESYTQRVHSLRGQDFASANCQ